MMASRKKRLLVPHKVPQLFISSSASSPKTFGLGRKYPFRYEAKEHAEVPRKIFLEKKAYMRSRPAFRPEQRFADFSAAFQPVQNPYLQGKSHGNGAFFGDDGVEYVSFVGLRRDEMHRVMKVRGRNAGGPESDEYASEHVYMPLSDMIVAKEDVENFWACQDWDLDLPKDAGLSNCVYCFLKGAGGLQKVHEAMSSNGMRTKRKAFADTPCDIEWWKRIEVMYGRDMKKEKRTMRSKVKNNFIGFFGASSGFSYHLLDQDGLGKKNLSRFSDSVLPCDCTD